jgi:hypothetical protein
MGNEESEFESQFYQLYTFVGLVEVEDPLYQAVKIYRRRKVTFDYVMVFEKDASEFEPAGIGSMARLEERLNLIRHYECESIARLQYWKVLNGRPSFIEPRTADSRPSACICSTTTPPSWTSSTQSGPRGPISPSMSRYWSSRVWRSPCWPCAVNQRGCRDADR